MTQELKVVEGYENFRVNAQDITLFESHVEMKLPNGMVKAIGIGDFINILSKTVGKETRMSTALLPANCYLWGQTITEMRIACYYPGKSRKVSVLGRCIISRDTGLETGSDVEYTIPFPNIVVSHILKKKTDHWEQEASRYFATSKNIGQLENQFIWEHDETNGIWTLPLPNVYPEGRLCYGHNSVLKGPFTDNFRGLDWHFALLYNSSFNDDLRIPSVAKSYRVQAWFEELAKHQVFPYELLTGGKKITAVSTTAAQNLMAEATAILDERVDAVIAQRENALLNRLLDTYTPINFATTQTMNRLIDTSPLEDEDILEEATGFEPTTTGTT